MVLWPDEALEDTIPNGQPRGRVTMGNADSSHLDAWDEVDKENLFNVLTAFENGRSLRINLKKELRPDETVRQCRDRMRAEAKRKKPKG